MFESGLLGINEGVIGIRQKSAKPWEWMRAPREPVTVRRDLRHTDVSVEKLGKEVKGCGQK